MEDKEIFEIYKQSFKKIFGDSLTEKELDDKVRAFFDKHNSIKKTENAVHIQYMGGIISNEDLKRLEPKLEEVDLELSSYDREGDPHASLEDYLLLIFIAVNEHILNSLYQDIKGNLKWEAIKYLLKEMYERIRGKKYNKIQGGKVESKDITFGLKMKLNENTEFDFSLSGLDEKTFLESLDKILPFISEQTKNPEYKIPYFVTYDPESKSWEKVDVMDEIRTKKLRKVKKRKKK